MKKISTLFKKDPSNLALVINEVDPQNQWVYEKGFHVDITRKFDGTSCAIINGEIYKRYDAKKGRKVPDGAIPCQEPDEITGHHPHWLKCERNKPEDKYFFEGFDKICEDFTPDSLNGTYELCGEKIQGNPEKIAGHKLIRHGADILPINNKTFEYLKKYLSDPINDIEGIVFHNTNDGRMCKIRKSDFGIKRINQ